MILFLRRAGRYAQVGLICAIINNLIVIGMDRLGYHYAVGVAVGFLMVMVVGYLLHCHYTFGTRAAFTGWIRFVTANLSGFPLSMGSMFLLCDVAHLSASLAMPIATMVLFGWNYILAHILIGRADQLPGNLTS